MPPTAAVTGTVVDSLTGQPVPRASLQAVRAGVIVGTAADDLGRWSFPFLPGEHVRVSSIGYTTRHVPAAALPGPFDLVPLVEELPGVTITPAPRRNLWPLLLAALLVADAN